MSRSKDLADYRINATFSVRYKHEGKWHILQPGQILPVWSVEHWDRCGPEVEVCLATASLDASMELVNLPGRQQISQEKYLVAKRSTNPDREEAQVLDQARLTPLGGASRFSILRPHRLPLGFGIQQAPVSSHDRKQQWEGHPLTMAQIIEPMQKFRQQSETVLPLPRLFVAAADGGAKGRDVTEAGKVIKLREVLLPVAPVPFDEDGEPLDTMDIAVQAARHLANVGGGIVYIGFGIYSGHDTTASVPADMISLDKHREVYAAESVMYTLPHGPADDFFAYIKAESRVRADALMRGDDSLEDRFIPVPEFIPGSHTEVVDQVPVWRAEDSLHEAGLA